MVNYKLFLGVLLFVVLSISVSANFEKDYISVSSYGLSNLNANFNVIPLHIENDGETDLEDVKIVLSIPELAIWDTVGPVDLDEGDDLYRNAYLDLYGTQPGWYYLRYSITTTSGYTKAKWYEVYIE